MQIVKAGLKAIYLSGWQVAADNNTAGTMYPDQSLYPSNSGPELCKRINRTLCRADQIEHAEGGVSRNWFVPIIADAEAGFGGPLNAHEVMKAYIEAGAAGVRFEDQLASEKKCGASRWQSAYTDCRARAKSERSAPCGGYLRCTDADSRTH